MNFSAPFIRRPVMTTLVMIAVLVFGWISYQKLPVSDLPNVDYPTIEAYVTYPGAKPETMATSCATPLEREFMTIDGLNLISSSSSTGTTSIVLQFSLDKPLETASIDVEAAITRAIPYLPKDLPYNPTYKKTNPAASPILYLALTSDSISRGDLYDYGNTYIGQRLSMIEGVAEVETFGAPYAARIQVNPEQLSAMGISLGEVAAAIKEGNVDLPTGTLFGQKREFTIDALGQLMKGSYYNDLSIKTKEGNLVKIIDVGRGLNSLKDDKYSLNYRTKDGEHPCVMLAVRRQSGKNTVEIIDAINTILPQLEKEIPYSINLHDVFNKKKSIVQGVNEVELTLILAFFLVAVIIYLSLGKLRNAIIPTFALPLSVIGTFGVMYLMGFNVDILSLLALTLSVGFLVDDAIVVLENNVRHVQEGMSPLDASLKGSKQISQTILSMTLCLSSVFIPMIFMGGVVGRLFQEFAITIVSAVIISGVISLTLTPLLCSRWIPKYEAQKKGKMEVFSEKIFSILQNAYIKSLHFVMQYKKTTLLIGVFSLVGSLVLAVVLPKDFLPNEDVSFLEGNSLAHDGTSPFLMKKYQEEINDTLLSDPAVNFLVSATAVATDNEGVMYVSLKPYSERGPLQGVIDRLMNKLFMIPGVNSFLSTLPLLNLQTGATARALYEYSISGINQADVSKATEAMVAKIQALEGFAQVSSDLKILQPQVTLEIDRDRASNLNVSVADIEAMLSLAYSDNKISTIRGSINQYDVILETLPNYYNNPSDLSKLYVRSKTGKEIRLDELINTKEGVGPLTVNHQNGLPSATISFDLKGISLSEAISALDEVAIDVLPATVSAQVQGTADVFKSSFATLPFLFLITIFIIYIILGILYESFIHPITVMSTLPPATFGGLASLYLTGSTLSLYSFVGIIMLLGIVMKNGIMMVDFANDGKTLHNKSTNEAILDACKTRFRPILMTTVSALMGAVPIAIGIGGSAALSRRSLGYAVVGGLIFSQLLTLYLTPITYYYLDILQDKMHRFFSKKNQEA